jgi:hypothetical protein
MFPSSFGRRILRVRAGLAFRCAWPRRTVNCGKAMQSYAELFRGVRSQPPQILKAVKTGAMGVAPAGL